MSGFVVFLQQADETMKVNSVFTILTIVVGVAQRPRLVWVKVCVASYSRPWKVGMGQEAPLAIEGWAVSVETWSKDDGDVHVFLAPLQLAVGHSLKAQWRHALPNVEGSPNGVVGLLSTHFGCHVFYAAEMWDKRQRVKKLDWRNAHKPDHFLFIIKPQIWISLSAVKMNKSIVNWSNKELTALGKINTLKSGLLCWMTTQRKKTKLKNRIKSGKKIKSCEFETWQGRNWQWVQAQRLKEANIAACQSMWSHYAKQEEEKTQLSPLLPARCHFTLVLLANRELNGAICERKQLSPPPPALSRCRCGEDGTISCHWNLFSN